MISQTMTMNRHDLQNICLSQSGIQRGQSEHSQANYPGYWVKRKASIFDSLVGFWNLIKI